MKLLRVISYLKWKRDDFLTLEADDEHTLYWFVDSAFAVHADMKIHTGSVFYLGKWMMVADSTKQKVNAKISTESELIGVGNRTSKIFWTRKFLECQGFKVKVNIIYQDKKEQWNCKIMVNPDQEREQDIMILIIFMLQI